MKILKRLLYMIFISVFTLFMIPLLIINLPYWLITGKSIYKEYTVLDKHIDKLLD